MSASLTAAGIGLLFHIAIGLIYASFCNWCSDSPLCVLVLASIGKVEVSLSPVGGGNGSNFRSIKFK